jgi:hypothetical protein
MISALDEMHIHEIVSQIKDISPIIRLPINRLATYHGEFYFSRKPRRSNGMCASKILPEY